MLHLKSKNNSSQKNQQTMSTQLSTVSAGQECFLTRAELARRWGVCTKSIARDLRLTSYKFTARRVRYALSDVLRVEREAGCAP